ncbi:MAG: ATP-dependent helicase [Planctomycetaceae bacterium]|nr:ATP-dependent helicase [Planctomycetaceae bacterium]
MKITEALDEFQLPFARDNRRALRLLAPAGSGKTHSLLWRCVQQWESAPKTKPRFLLFTFTRAARDELRDRLRMAPEFAGVRDSIEVSTLNAWGFRRLKARTHNLRLLTSRNDQFWAVNNNLQPIWSEHPKLRELLLQTRSRNRTAKAVMAVMDGLKSLGFRHDIHHTANEFANHLVWLDSVGLVTYLANLIRQLADLEIVDAQAGNIIQEMENGFLGFWRDATVSLRQMAMITLEDQKYWAWLDLEEAIAEGKFTTGIHRCDHILVDEFQDVNCLDLRLLQAIAAVNKAELTLIGDDDQAIYEWRGASPQFILQPQEHIGPAFTTHILSRNYRCPWNIVMLSQRLIKHNTRRVDKEVDAASPVDAQVDVLMLPSITETIDYVLAQVCAMLNEGVVKKVAIIGRKRAQIIPYQIVFASHNIPFYAAEDLQVFLSDAFGELKDMLGIKARDDAGPIPGMDPIQDFIKLVDKVKRYPLSKAERGSLLRHLQSERPTTVTACLERLLTYTGPLKGNNDDCSRSRVFVSAILPLLTAKTVSEAIQAISDHFEGLQKDYGKSIQDVFYTDPPFLHLADFAQRYGTDYTAFYEDLDKAIATLARLPDEDEKPAPNREPAWKLPLHLMTALRAKGKEFDAVVILDANKDIWPSKLATTPERLEEERRVFYVAVTRARKRLMLLVNQSILGAPALPSPYIGEMGLVPRPYTPG